MNWDQIEGKWKQLKGSAKERWGKLTDDDLDAIPDLSTHYQRASFPDRDPILERGTIAMAGRPIWQILVGPCINHAREHLAELDLFKRLLRGDIRGSQASLAEPL